MQTVEYIQSAEHMNATLGATVVPSIDDVSSSEGLALWAILLIVFSILIAIAVTCFGVGLWFREKKRRENKVLPVRV